MKETLNRLKNVVSDCAVTIILRTYRTHPDNLKDGIKLKNMASEARQRLTNEYDESTAKRLGDKIDKLIDDIDISHNLEGLVLFVDDNHAEYIRLPIELNDRIVIDDTFATRSLFRALNVDTRYYLLILSKDKARMLKASSDNVELEISEEFPMENKDLQAASRAEAANAERLTNLQLEFFNRVDKAVNKIHGEEPHPIYVAADSGTFGAYKKIADKPNTLFGEVTLANKDVRGTLIIKEVWPAILKQTQERNLNRKKELTAAISSGKILSDYTEIWKALEQNRGQTLFVQEGFYQPARVEADGKITLIEMAEISDRKDVDDIIDEMIERNSLAGGDVVFLPEKELKEFRGLALIVRF